MSSASFQIRNAEFGMRKAAPRPQPSGADLPKSEFRIPNSEVQNPNSEFRIPNSLFREAIR